jgi:hypothetical protein
VFAEGGLFGLPFVFPYTCTSEMMIELRIMSMRILSRALLITVFFAALGLVVFLLIQPRDRGTWTTLTALLAVIAASISAWPALRVLEIQEDLSRPHPMPYFDFTSRYQLLLLRVKNLGAGVAYDVRLTWDTHPRNEDGEELTAQDTIAVLIPQDSASVLVGRPNQLFQKYPVMRFEGTVEFKDVTGKTKRHKFICSADEHRKRLVHDDELPRTLYDLQKIPQSLSEIQKAIHELQK